MPQAPQQPYVKAVAAPLPSWRKTSVSAGPVPSGWLASDCRKLLPTLIWLVWKSLQYHSFSGSTHFGLLLLALAIMLAMSAILLLWARRKGWW
jgi:hypothetical protein